MYYLGVDGGGTKTKYVLIDEGLKKIAEIEGGTIHIHQVGVNGLTKELSKNIHELCSSKGIEEKDIAFAFLGVPGYGESLDDMNKIDYVVNEVINIPHMVDNDAVNGWAAGTACKPGINIVAGTGSIAYGRNKSGKIARCGGWGPGIGDDGSAYWIALKVINEYTKQKDGRSEKTVLVDILEKEYETTYKYEIVDIVFNKLKFSRTELAGFSKICYLAAESGCEAARKIFQEAAENLFRHIKSLSEILLFEEEFIVSYTGGVFKAGKYILEPLEEMIKENRLKCRMQEPELEPWDGAALLAFQLAGNEIPSDYREIMTA